MWALPSLHAEELKSGSQSRLAGCGTKSWPLRLLLGRTVRCIFFWSLPTVPWSLWSPVLSQGHKPALGFLQTPRASQEVQHGGHILSFSKSGTDGCHTNEAVSTKCSCSP